MANEDLLKILKQGPGAWGEWRADNLGVNQIPNKVDLTRAKLNGAKLGGANLSGAELRDAKLGGADLRDAYLDEAELRGADLNGANLSRAKLVEADLSKADLRDANLVRAVLNKSIITGTDFRGAKIDHADVTSIVYKRKQMRGKYLGLRGIDSCAGDAIFRREAMDQDYIYTIENRLGGTIFMIIFRLWQIIDFGRSITMVMVSSFILSCIFGAIYDMFPSFLNYANSANTWYTPYYYSIVTFTPLGFGDVTPNNIWGEVLVTIEVIFGYLTLGLLIAILAQKVARRS